MDSGRDYVMLAGQHVRRDALNEEFAPLDDEALSAEIARVVAEHPGYLPEDRWRVVHRTDDSVVVASDGKCKWSGWGVLSIERSGYQWRQTGGISFGQNIKPTPEDNACGLALSFTQDVYEVARGRDIVAVAVRLTNISSEHIDGSTGSPVIGYVLGAPAEARVENLYVAGMGRDYSLRPGKSIEIPVLLATQVDRLPPGEYALEATMDDLALTAHSAILRIGPTRRPK
jgi:hypothetical protein